MWKCGASVAKNMNKGSIGIYDEYFCDGSCGSSHSTKSGQTFGELFGKE